MNTTRSTPTSESVEVPTQREFNLLVLSGVFSALCAIDLGFYSYHSQFYLLWICNGLVHFFVFGTTLWYVRVSIERTTLCSIGCALFPLWGTLLGMCGFYILSGLLCSIAWGFVLSSVFDDKKALYSMIVIGLISTLVLMSYPVIMKTYVLGNWELYAQMGVWHILSSYVLVRLAVSRRAYLVELTQHVCSNCHYQLDGLPKNAPCPECGQMTPQQFD